MATKNSVSSSEQHSDDESNEWFNAHSISIKVQKKIVGILPNLVVKFFLDQASARLFDNIYNLIKIYSNSSKLASKLTKQAVKVNVKSLILISNDILNDDELNMAAEFHELCHQVAEIVLRLGRPKRRILPGIEPSQEKLITYIHDSSELMLKAIENHMSKNSQDKFREFVDFCTQKQFINDIFSDQQKYGTIMEKIYDDLEDMMDRGLF